MTIQQESDDKDNEFTVHAIAKVVSTTRIAWLQQEPAPTTAQVALAEPRPGSRSRRARGGSFYAFPASFAS